MRRLIAITVVAACADPVVDMQLVLPKNADNFDTKCITAVEVRVTGGNFLQDDKDYRRSCIELQGGASYTAIRDAIRGKFEVAIPDTGITGIDIYGWSGVSACKYDDNPFVSPDLLFFGRGDYFGQDRVDIPVVPNVSCATNEVKARMVDMFALVGGATCQVAGTTMGSASIGIGTLVPRLYGKGTRLFGNIAGADMVGNLSTFTGPTVTGPRSCLALDGGDQLASASISCAIGGATVCAGPGEMELASVPYAITANAANVDATLMTKFPGLIYGSVWSNGATKSTLAGATVTVDSAHGKVIYVDPPNPQGVLAPRADQTVTGPSGLFVLYADTLVSAKITGGGFTRTVTLGAMDESPAGAIIVMGP